MKILALSALSFLHSFAALCWSRRIVSMIHRERAKGYGMAPISGLRLFEDRKLRSDRAQRLREIHSTQLHRGAGNPRLRQYPSVRHRSNQAGVSQSPKIPARLCGLPLPRLCPHPRPNRLRQHQPGHPTIKAMLTRIAQALDQVGAGRVRAPASANSAAANLPARSTPPTNT